MIRKKLYKIILIIIILIFGLKGPVFADVGDFETYKSDSSWSSSGSLRSRDSFESSWSDRHLYDDRDEEKLNIDSKELGKVILVVGMGILLGFIIFRILTKKDRDLYNSSYSNHIQDSKPQTNPEEEIISKIKKVDEKFNADEFASWVRDLFIKLQYAWSDRDWSIIRCFETKELYEQHSTQLQRYIQNKQINKLERVSVNSVKFLSFEQSGDQEILNVVVNSKMIDYIIDEVTEQIIKGDKNSYKINNYKLTFVRKAGIKTIAGRKINVMNCPNCGAPTEITSSGKCQYCGSVITTTEHDWVLSNLERYINLV